MAKRPTANENTSANASAAQKHSPSPKPLFEARYELTTLLTQEAASLLTPTGTTNPAYIFVYICLGALLLYALWGELAQVELNVPVMLLLAFAIAGLLYIAQHWQDRMRKRLAQEGLDAALLAQDARAFSVDVYDDAVVVKTARGEQRYPLSTLTDARMGSLLTVLSFKEGNVLIPKKSLSASRYNQLQDFFRTRMSSKGIGAKVRRKGTRHA